MKKDKVGRGRIVDPRGLIFSLSASTVDPFEDDAGVETETNFRFFCRRIYCCR